MNFCFLYGCRPSAGVKANTDMVEDLLLALMLNSDRINQKVVLPNAFEYLTSKDASFETATSSRIQTLMLFHRYDIVTHSIGLVVYHEQIYESCGLFKMERDLEKKFNAVVPSHQMLKEALKLDEVHTFGELSKSQLIEKVDSVTEKTYFFEL